MIGTGRSAWPVLLTLVAAAGIGIDAADERTPPARSGVAVVADTQIAPDGRSVAFTRKGQPAERGKGASQASLWRVSFAGGEPQRLTSADVEDSRPRWSPDGQRIAFLSRSLAEHAPARVLIVPAPGGDPRAVTDPQTDVSAFEWSPDGRRIAYLAARPDRAAQPALWILSLDSGRAETPASLGEGAALGFRWSPDSSALVAILAGSNGTSPRLVILPLAGSPRQIAASTVPVCELDWSPDGATIAWLERAEGTDAKPPRIWAVSAAGGPAHILSSAGAGSPQHIAWTGDGRLSIAFASSTGETQIDLLDVRTGARITVLPPGIANMTSAPSWSADGSRYAVAGSTPEHAAEVFAGSLPLPIPKEPDFVGAPPPPVRRITFSNP